MTSLGTASIGLLDRGTKTTLHIASVGLLQTIGDIISSSGGGRPAYLESAWEHTKPKSRHIRDDKDLIDILIALKAGNIL